MLLQCEREHKKLPKWLLEKPMLLSGLEIYWTGFVELTSDRRIGISGESWIPWTAIRLYCKEMGLSSEQTEDMHYHIKAMDAAYLEHIKKK